MLHETGLRFVQEASARNEPNDAREMVGRQAKDVGYILNTSRSLQRNADENLQGRQSL